MAKFLHSFVKNSKNLRDHSYNMRCISLKHLILTLLLVSSFALTSQIKSTSPDDDKNRFIPAAIDTSSPELTQERITKIDIAERNMEDWKSGKSKYPPKPKNMWELGLGLGHYFIHGDIDPCIPGYGIGLHVRKALHYTFSLRMDLFYGVAYGLEAQPYTSALDNEPTVFKGYGTNFNNNAWFPSYRTTYYYGALEGVLNIGNILFHKDRNTWNWYLFLGAGLDHNKTELDLQDANGNYYTNLISSSGYTFDKFNTRKGRSDIKKNLENIYDGTYETEAYKKAGIFRLNDDVNVHLIFIAGMGIARKISNRFNIALEHQVNISDNDYLDGIIWRSNLDQTSRNDVQHFTNLRLAINLGSFKKRKEPLYWLNPLDAAFSDLAELKKRPKFDLKDTDEDGVIDLLDQEPNTPPGSPVDTRGITLDSDNDGIPDYKDTEPFSPPGYQVDNNGVAQMPSKPSVSEDDLKKMIDQRLGVPPGTFEKTDGRGLLSYIDWFLPMIHFKLDEYCVDVKYAPELASVAYVLRTHPAVNLIVEGHTDIRNSNAYNRVLSYNRAKETIDYLVNTYKIPRSRLILTYGGEENPLGGHARNHSINRRVEFRPATDADKDMPKPEGPNAGECNKKR
jgi:OmpA-OmpF porin, OOP family